MINSLGVHFNITRQCTQNELKNINIFNKKNHLCRFARNRKTFLEKDLQHNFVLIVGIGASYDLTHNISKS
jgi:hypothetical protein